LICGAPLFFARGIGVFDDSVYLKIGELILDGLIPYRDVFDIKPPGIYYLGALIAWIGRSHWLAPRIFLFIFAVIFGAWVIEYTRKYWGNLAAYIVAGEFGLSYIIAQGYSFHTEQFCAFFGFAAIVVVSGKRRNASFSWLIAGFLLGLAFLFKQVAVIYLVAMILSSKLRQSWSKARILSLNLVAGFTTIIILLFSAMVASGIWQDFYNSVFMSLPLGRPLNLYKALSLSLKAPSAWLSWLSLILFISSRQLRRVLKDSPSYSDWVMITIIGIMSILPIVKLESHSHYLNTSVAALGISSAVVLSNLIIQLEGAK